MEIQTLITLICSGISVGIGIATIAISRKQFLFDRRTKGLLLIESLRKCAKDMKDALCDASNDDASNDGISYQWIAATNKLISYIQFEYRDVAAAHLSQPLEDFETNSQTLRDILNQLTVEATGLSLIYPDSDGQLCRMLVDAYIETAKTLIDGSRYYISYLENQRTLQNGTGQISDREKADRASLSKDYREALNNSHIRMKLNSANARFQNVANQFTPEKIRRIERLSSPYTSIYLKLIGAFKETRASC